MLTKYKMVTRGALGCAYRADKNSNITILQHIITILGDSQNYMPPILVPSSAKRIAT